MANIILKNGWNEAKPYYNVASVSFPAVEGGEAVYYENASGGGGSDGLGAQADWNENNSDQASYIKNRPFYVYYEPIYQSNLVQFTINSISNLYEAVIRIPQPIIENKSYVVYWRDTGYLCTATKINNEIYLGDLSLIDASYAQDDPEPFVAFYDNTTNSIVFSTSSEEAYRIVGLFDGEEQVQKLDKKFLPNDIAAEADWSATEGQPGFINNKPDLTVYAEKAVIAETLKNYETIKSAETRIENVTKSFNETLKNYETTQAVNEKVETLNQEIAKRATKEEVEQAFQDTQADWSIEDESNLASIRNKPFGDIPDLLSNTELTFVLNEETGAYEAETGLILEPGINYVVTWNEEEFLCQVEEEDNGHFILTEQGVFITQNPVENPVVTVRKEDNVYRIDKKYLPVDEILDGIASEDYVEESIKAIPQPDWNQTNQSEPDYIKHKPTIPSIAGLASEQYVKQAVADSRADWESIDIGNNRYIANKPFGTMPLYFSEEKEYNFTYNSYSDISKSEETVEGLHSYLTDKIYVFYFDGNRYELKYETYSNSNGEIMYCFGNPYLVGKYYQRYYPDNKLPFGCGMDDCFYVRGNQTKHRIAYYSLETEEKLLDAKWLPSTVASTAYVNNYVNQKIEESTAGTQSDWNSIDASSTSFIKNRPFGYVQDLLANYSVICQQGAATIGNLCFCSNFNIKFKAEETYIITWDNIEYELIAYETSFKFPAGIGFSNAVFLGNQKIITEAGASSEQPLPYESDVPFYMGNGFIFMKNNSQNLTTQYTLSIRLKNNYQKIKLSDLPDEVININPDWEQTDPEAPDYIKNKPTFLSTQPNWKQTNPEAQDYIKNKPVHDLPAYSEREFQANRGGALVYSPEEGWVGGKFFHPDWSITNMWTPGYILNKPFGYCEDVLDIKQFSDRERVENKDVTMFAIASQHQTFLEKDREYEINLSGTKYKSICRLFYNLNDDIKFYVLGNASLIKSVLSLDYIDGLDTKESYGVLILTYQNNYTTIDFSWAILIQKGDFESASLSISSAEKIKKISKEFLPDECFSNTADRERISTLEKLVEAQANLISQMQQQLQDLTQRVERLEQGYTPPSGPGASVNGDTLEVEGNVADEILTIQGGAVSNETLTLSGGSGTQATVDGEELTINGLIANEVLNLGSGTVIGETLGLTGDANVVIEETVSTTGIINDDILSSSGVVTADETWEVN